MLIIGCDLHTRYQEIAVLDTATGEIETRRLEHENEEARRFYASLPERALVGIEATGCTQWFERLLAQGGHELWVGDPAEIRARAVRRQKTDPALRDRAPAGSAAGEPVPTHLGSLAGGTRLPTTAEASGQAGADADFGEEPTALLGDEPGGVPKAEAVERAGAPGAGRAEPGAVGEPTAARTVGTAGPAAAPDRGTRHGRGSRGRVPSGRGSIDEAAGRGAGHGFGFRADAGAGGALSEQSRLAGW